MSTPVVAVGEGALLSGYALAGVEVIDTVDAEATRAAWDRLPAGVELVLLTPPARAALGPRVDEGRTLWVEVPG